MNFEETSIEQKYSTKAVIAFVCSSVSLLIVLIYVFAYVIQLNNGSSDSSFVLFADKISRFCRRWIGFLLLASIPLMLFANHMGNAALREIRQNSTFKGKKLANVALKMVYIFLMILIFWAISCIF